MRHKPRQFEHLSQCAVIAQCRMMERKYPELKCLMAIPNGGQRHIAVARKLKAEGVKSGVSDLFLALPVPNGPAGLWVEMKAPDGVVSQNQEDFIYLMRWVGYRAIVCWSVDEAVDEITKYLNRYRNAKKPIDLGLDLAFLKRQAD